MEKYSKAWTDDDILEALWMRDEGYTFKEIGAHFGVTRKAHDLLAYTCVDVHV